MSRYSNDEQDVLNHYILPFILWGPNVIPKEDIGEKKDWFGSHSDIGPTLIHLLADQPLDYYSFGSPMWDQSKIVFSHNAVANNKYIYLCDRDLMMNYHTNTEVAPSKEIRNLRRRHAALSVIGHLILYEGNRWKK